jgi:3-hydroxyacyl-CoA dehydrogenase/enoyl-CoA hydratase/3-hydroxybutyryl-CoA epimerase/enoyl-CoA isomerase
LKPALLFVIYSHLLLKESNAVREFTGKKLRTKELEHGIALLTLSAGPEQINKFDQNTLSELHTALSFLENSPLNGLVLSSDQSVFLAGGDINEFLARFQQPADKIQAEVNSYQQALNRIESLPYPTLCAINGAALGGGIEIALACDYRLAVCDALLGSPEVNLGLIPGTGATVRLPRVAGVENALHWIADGNQVRADQSNIGLIDEICFTRQELSERALEKIQQVMETPQDWQQRRLGKQQPMSQLPPPDVYSKALDRLAAIYPDDLSLPARQAAIYAIAESTGSTQSVALAIESLHLIQQSQTDNCRLLINEFLNRKAARALDNTGAEAGIAAAGSNTTPEAPHFSG